MSELDRTSEAKGTMFQMGKLRLNVGETLRALYHAVIVSCVPVTCRVAEKVDGLGEGQPGAQTTWTHRDTGQESELRGRGIAKARPILALYTFPSKPRTTLTTGIRPARYRRGRLGTEVEQEEDQACSA